MENDTQFNLLFKVKKTQVEMMRDRQIYEIKPEDEKYLDPSYTFEQFYRDNYNENPLDVYQKLDSVYREKTTNKYTKIYYINGSKNMTDKKLIQHALSDYERSKSQNINHIILICRYIISTRVLSDISDIQTREYPIEIFYFTELSFNVTKHSLVPKHNLIDSEERKRIITQIGDINNLPKIFIDDPVVKYYNWKAGKIIRVDRFEPVEGVAVSNNIFYRLIINKKKPDGYKRVM